MLRAGSAGQGGQHVVVGYSVAIRTTGGATPIFFGGGKLAKDLTLPHLRQFWAASNDDSAAALVEWSAPKSVFPGREALGGHPNDWRRAVAAVERSVERLRAVPVSDLPAWRGAAPKPPECSPPGRGAWKGRVQDLWRQQQTYSLDRHRADRMNPGWSEEQRETSEE